MEPKRIEFSSEHLGLVGHLRVPPGDGALPGIVFTGPFTGVKEQVTGLYADRLAEAGFVTLAFDHRNFGESGGEPRQHEDSAGKLVDLRDATSFLAALPEVDAGRIGACGICLGGSYALRFAAFDPRIHALALVAGGYNDPREMREGMGADGYREQLARFAGLAQRQHETGEVSYMAAVSSDGPAVMAGAEPFEYYGTKRGASPHWENRITELSIRELITLDAASAADFISPTPMLVVHGTTDDYCSPDGARSVYERAGDPKDILWLETTNHIDLYDQEPYVEPAVERAAAWFNEYL